MPDIKIMPSLLAADQGRLTEECQRCECAGSDGVHVDVMDGHFVPNINYGPNVVEVVAKAVSIEVNTHLMITDPEKYIEAFVAAGTDTLTLHVESRGNIGDLLRRIRELGVKPGLVLNPDTPFTDEVAKLAEGADELMFMTVFPGFGGQAFMASVMPQIEKARAYFPEKDISVDGGLNRDTALIAGKAGANLIHIGTGVFKAANMKEEIAHIRASLT